MKILPIGLIQKYLTTMPCTFSNNLNAFKNIVFCTMKHIFEYKAFSIYSAVKFNVSCIFEMLNKTLDLMKQSVRHRYKNSNLSNKAKFNFIQALIIYVNLFPQKFCLKKHKN